MSQYSLSDVLFVLCSAVNRTRSCSVLSSWCWRRRSRSSLSVPTVSRPWRWRLSRRHASSSLRLRLAFLSLEEEEVVFDCFLRFPPSKRMLLSDDEELAFFLFFPLFVDDELFFFRFRFFNENERINIVVVSVLISCSGAVLCRHRNFENSPDVVESSTSRRFPEEGRSDNRLLLDVVLFEEEDVGRSPKNMLWDFFSKISSVWGLCLDVVYGWNECTELEEDFGR